MKKLTMLAAVAMTGLVAQPKEPVKGFMLIQNDDGRVSDFRLSLDQGGPTELEAFHGRTSVECDHGCDGFDWGVTKAGRLTIELKRGGSAIQKSEIGTVAQGSAREPGMLFLGTFDKGVVEKFKDSKSILIYPCIDDGFSDLPALCRRQTVTLKLRLSDGERVEIKSKRRLVKREDGWGIGNQ